MVYKIIVFWLGSIFFIPFGYFACRVFKPAVYAIFALMLLSLGDVDDLSITFFGHQEYKMATRGLEIALADLCAIVLLLYILFTTPRQELIKFPPLTLPQFFFIFVAVLSWLATKSVAPNPLAAEIASFNPNSQEYSHALEPTFRLGLYPLFEIAKLFRGFLFFWIAVNLSKDPNIIRVMYVVFSVLIVYFTAKSLILRYVYGVNRVTAGIGHYNNFNTFVGLMGAFMLPLAFSSKRFLISAFIWILMLSTVVCIILTISRSALAAFGIALFFGVPVLLLKFFNAKNLLFMMLGILTMIGLLAKAEKTLTERFVYKNPTEKAWAERTALNNEAKMMAHDFPLGVGLGNFSAWSILRYSQLTGAEIGNFAHNSFYLTMGEMGYLGLFAFMVFWGRFAQLGFIAFIYRLLGNDRFAFGAIMGADLAILFLLPQLWFQFTYRVSAVYLLVHIILGVGIRQYLMVMQEKKVSLLESLTGKRAAV